MLKKGQSDNDQHGMVVKAMAKAMNYMLTRWDGFTRFLGDGRLYLTNDAAERGLRVRAVVRSLCPSSSSAWKH